LTHTFFAGPYT
jgi:predicted RNase H-like nuclease (RuvC/YqgF family)